MTDGDSGNVPGRAPAIPRGFLVANLIGGCVGVGVGLALYFGQSSTFGLFIALWVLLAGPVMWRLRIQRGRRLYDPTVRRDRHTGQTLARPGVTEVRVPGCNAMQWTGAADVPTPLGRINATNPLAVLAVVDSTLTLRLRPAVVARWACGVEPLVLSRSQVEAVFPARARFRYPAIGIRPVNEPPSYFLTAPGRLRWYFGPWSADRASILSAIEAAGFPVEWEERAFSRS